MTIQKRLDGARSSLLQYLPCFLAFFLSILSLSDTHAAISISSQSYDIYSDEPLLVSWSTTKGADCRYARIVVSSRFGYKISREVFGLCGRSSYDISGLLADLGGVTSFTVKVYEDYNYTFSQYYAKYREVITEQVIHSQELGAKTLQIISVNTPPSCD